MPDGTSWNESEPADNALILSIPSSIRDTKAAVNLRLSKEHAEFDNASVGGEHAEGSAKAYYDTSAPQYRPDGNTALDSNDEGRLWVKTGLNLWDGSAWRPVFNGGTFVYGSATVTDDDITFTADYDELSEWNGSALTVQKTGVYLFMLPSTVDIYVNTVKVNGPVRKLTAGDIVTLHGTCDGGLAIMRIR